MKILRAILATMFLVTLVTLNTFASYTSSMAVKPDSPRLRWKGKTVKISISNGMISPNSSIKSDSDVISAIKSSLESWQSIADVDFVVEITDKQSVSPSGVSGDGVSLITIAQTPENVLLFSKDPQAESAITRYFYNGKGFITEADIVLNPFQQFSTDGTFGTFDLQATITHEIGHLLGLHHSSVLGATMSESRPRNGAFGISDLSSRSLAESDIAAIRDLYGVKGDEVPCCAAIAGKLLTADKGGVKNIRVWVEDSETGRVAAQVEAAGDGSFRIGGLPEATYSIFWEKKDDGTGSAFGELDPATVIKGETTVLSDKMVLKRPDFSLEYLGINSQLADSAVPLVAGRQYLLYLGGKHLNSKGINIVFNSRYIKVIHQSVSQQDFGDEVSVINVTVNVDQNAPPGSYSIFAARPDGSISSMIGALSVE
ncbi:hypothetical protein BH10ACI2_BH10ACI2_23030 [soil metagenome]